MRQNLIEQEVALLPVCLIFIVLLLLNYREQSVADMKTLLGYGDRHLP